MVYFGFAKDIYNQFHDTHSEQSFVKRWSTDLTYRNDLRFSLPSNCPWKSHDALGDGWEIKKSSEVFSFQHEI